ncbi:MAG: hypothetical protein LBG96_17465 [Tannerella sp.]|jgi:hypothetical protein|nr:hypothetical protein [Tannerella sp.]
MKLTTKIISGIILSAFALSLLFIIGFSFTDRKYFKRAYNNTITRIPQDNMMGIEVEPYRVIVLDTERPDTENNDAYGFGYDECGLFINPAATPDKENKLFIPEALHGFISAKTNDDTLTIRIKIDELRKKYKKEDADNYTFFAGINLHLYTSNTNVINKITSVQTKISNIETDTIRVNAWGDIHIDSCKAIVINPVLEENYRKLTVKNSYARTIHLDLDRINNWNIENCKIKEENLTGSNRHSITKHRNESGTINWYPKNKDAELNIKVQGDVTQIIFQ